MLSTRVSVIEKGISDSCRQAQITLDGAGSTINANATQSNGCNSKYLQITLTDIDSYVASNELDVRLIKLDIEGAELSAIYGAMRTIKEHRPVLLVSIYHTAKDFFEIKPLIESSVPGYRFMIRHLDANHMFLEYMLIGIPNID